MEGMANETMQIGNFSRWLPAANLDLHDTTQQTQRTFACDSLLRGNWCNAFWPLCHSPQHPVAEVAIPCHSATGVSPHNVECLFVAGLTSS